jgi:hypothetical protein
LSFRGTFDRTTDCSVRNDGAIAPGAAHGQRANVAVPPVTVAVPEKETLLPPLAAHALALRALSRSEPVLPRSTALPLNVTKV